MYKGRSAAYQRRYKVHEIAPAASVEDDFIPSAGNMSLDEAQAERGRLMFDKVRLEQEIGVAKRNCEWAKATAIGQQYLTICSRLGLVNKRIKALNIQRSTETFRQAVYDVVPDEMLSQIYARCKELDA